MSRYEFHGLTLDVAASDAEAASELERILAELSWERVERSSAPARFRFSVRIGGEGLEVPAEARELFRADDFRALEHADDFFLTDGENRFRFEAERGRGEARLAPDFFQKPLLFRQNLWVFALLKMLRAAGVFGLHAAGLVGDDGAGVLFVGPSGSGKSTLSIGLVRRGWRYLSDDAVLLRARPEGIEALALRRHFYVVEADAADHADLPFGESRPDRCGGLRTRIGIVEAFPSQRSAACVPRVVLFTGISGEPGSTLVALDRATALRKLLEAGGPQLFDSRTMPAHLAALNQLLAQAAAFELRAGLDLYREPALLSLLLRDASEEKRCLASSSS
jgi:hypothetical protein